MESSRRKSLDLTAQADVVATVELGATIEQPVLDVRARKVEEVKKLSEKELRAMFAIKANDEKSVLEQVKLKVEMLKKIFAQKAHRLEQVGLIASAVNYVSDMPLSEEDKLAGIIGAAITVKNEIDNKEYRGIITSVARFVGLTKPTDSDLFKALDIIIGQMSAEEQLHAVHVYQSLVAHNNMRNVVAGMGTPVLTNTQTNDRPEPQSTYGYLKQNSLLFNIEKFNPARLQSTQTNDRSAPAIVTKNDEIALFNRAKLNPSYTVNAQADLVMDDFKDETKYMTAEGKKRYEQYQKLDSDSKILFEASKQHYVNVKKVVPEADLSEIPAFMKFAERNNQIRTFDRNGLAAIPAVVPAQPSTTEDNDNSPAPSPSMRRM